MEADPLVITEGRLLDTSRARNRARELRQSHDRALRGTGINTGCKVNDYVHSLNGFSARVNHRQAEKLAGQSGVAFVVPDVLRQPKRTPAATSSDSPGPARRTTRE